MGDITKNFSTNELASQGEVWSEIPQAHQNSLIYIAKNILQPARNILNIGNVKDDIAIHISSGYRSQKHNASVGGATFSQHMVGKAVDIFIANKTGLELFVFMLKHFGILIGGIGLYSNESLSAKFIHIDIRDKQSKNSVIAWYCNSEGVYMPVTPLMRKLALQENINLLG